MQFYHIQNEVRRNYSVLDPFFLPTRCLTQSGTNALVCSGAILFYFFLFFGLPFIISDDVLSVGNTLAWFPIRQWLDLNILAKHGNSPTSIEDFPSPAFVCIYLNDVNLLH